jgi:hypothetical protein
MKETEPGEVTTRSHVQCVHTHDGGRVLIRERKLFFKELAETGGGEMGAGEVDQWPAFGVRATRTADKGHVERQVIDTAHRLAGLGRRVRREDPNIRPGQGAIVPRGDDGQVVNGGFQTKIVRFGHVDAAVAAPDTVMEDETNEFGRPVRIHGCDTQDIELGGRDRLIDG